MHVALPPGMDYDRFWSLPDIHGNAVTPGYFAAMRTRILRGRAIDSSDATAAAAVVVVSNHMAKTFWPGRDAIGQCVPFEGRNRQTGQAHNGGRSLC